MQVLSKFSFKFSSVKINILSHDDNHSPPVVVVVVVVVVAVVVAVLVTLWRWWRWQ